MCIRDRVADTVVSQRQANNLIRGVMDRTYTPNQNGPREYFIECDDDIRMSLSLGSYPIPPTMVMTSAQQAFGSSGHQKDKVRALNEGWNLERTHANEQVRYLAGIELGETITLETTSGLRHFVVGGFFHDYGNVNFTLSLIHI